MIKKEIFLKSINFIGVDFNTVNFNFAEDTIMNIINFQFASNGYLYNIRDQSAFHPNMEEKNELAISNNIIL